ncbi:MAG: hypothetical protein JO303_01680 [Caulobacteraceae bacterium]|nr:hypothetical protein [Caulobacteraceae bacterium]
MSAEIVAFRRPSRTAVPDALVLAIAELRALIALDSVMGASPVRPYFVLNPAACAMVGACVTRPSGGPGAADAYALVAYDFPFALHSLDSMMERGIPPERAREIVLLSAELQQETLRRAASALGIAAQAVEVVDARALKLTFFPKTQETVVHVFRLSLARS